MDLTLIYIFLAVDFVLICGVFWMLRGRRSQDDVLEEVTEERRMIGEMKDLLFERMEKNEKNVKRISADIHRVAAEISEEARNSKEQISLSLERAMGQLGQELDQPLLELARKQAGVEVLLRKLSQEERSLSQSLKKALEVKSFFEAAIPHSEILDDLETRRFSEARERIMLGEDIDQIGSEMNFTNSEKNLLRNLLRQKSSSRKSATSP